MADTDGPPPGGGSDLEPAREAVRSASKWLIASFGAIGAVLVAGSQLSTIGDLELTDPRLWAAIASLVLALTAVFVAIWLVVDLLLPVKWTIQELAREWEEASEHSWFVGLRHPEYEFLKDNDHMLGGYADVPAVAQAWAEASWDDDLTDINALIAFICDVASYRSQVTKFRRRRWLLACSMAVAGLGVITFAWAANPPTQPPPSLRGADLTNADMRGTHLEGVDLTGANLSEADFRGAQMSSAVLEGATWSNTICPDGTNSRDVTVTHDKGKRVQSCQGHLQP